MATANKDRPLRILQVVGETNRGGAETWLLHVLRHSDRTRVQMDFLVHTQTRGAYDAELTSLGARVLVCEHPRNPIRYFRNLRRLWREYGPYDVVHSHVDYFGGFVLFYAALLGARVRVAHSHNDTRGVDRAAGFWRRLYTRLMRFSIRIWATAGAATSPAAAATLFGEYWARDSRWRVMPACIDLSPFEAAVNRHDMRRELGIADGAIVVGHVGRFVEQKNQRFLVDIAEIAAQQNTRILFVLVGDGPTKASVEAAIAERRLQEKFLVLPGRDDVPRLMLGVFDCFLFPSLYEGLGLAAVEAQAAGLLCYVSTGVPVEAIAVPALVERIPLSTGAAHWAEKILDALQSTSVQVAALDAVRSAGFDIQRNARRLTEFYCHQSSF
ncbi:MAG TPA: glycosyltransferase [Bryobacteraceae bacterium]|nr:glycosyltransferase [Bryobacteraceae bacterium]